MAHKSAQPALLLKEVRLQFGTFSVLTDIQFEAGIGERCALLGINGAGKTTLLSVINGDLKLSSGEIYFFGDKITKLPPYKRTHLGLRRTYQISLLFAGLSVLDHLYLACQGVVAGRHSLNLNRPTAKHPTMREAEAILETVQLQDIKDVPISALSHGQQRQLEVGMALAGTPKFILFDEPAAGLSSRERVILTDILDNLPKDIGYLLVEHDLDIALSIADRIIVLHDGRIFKDGASAEVQKDAEVQRLYLGSRHDPKS